MLNSAWLVIALHHHNRMVTGVVTSDFRINQMMGYNDGQKWRRNSCTIHSAKVRRMPARRIGYQRYVSFEQNVFCFIGVEGSH